MEEKICRKCNKSKDLNDFHKKKGTKDGHRNECKECVKEIQKKYKDAPDFKEKRKEYDKKRYEENKEFRNQQKKDWYYKNHDHALEQKREYHKKPNIKERQKKWWKKYKEENEDKLKEYRKNNKLKNREYSSNYRRKNPHIIAWRSVLHSTLKRLETNKSGHTIDLLGYSADDLKNHIENLFTQQMSWENHGEWHIDHINPVSSFDKGTDVSIVCALSNLQPLWSTTREIDGVLYEGNLNKSNN